MGMSPEPGRLVGDCRRRGPSAAKGAEGITRCVETSGGKPGLAGVAAAVERGQALEVRFAKTVSRHGDAIDGELEPGDHPRWRLVEHAQREEVVSRC